LYFFGILFVFFFKSRKSQEDGIAKVLEGNYAYLMESSTIEYVTNLNCNLTQIGGLLDSKGYGIATEKCKSPKFSKFRVLTKMFNKIFYFLASPLRDQLSVSILKLQENGIIEELKQMWWKQNASVCAAVGRDPKTSLDMDSFGGIYIILCGGIALALVVALVEFCSKKNYINLEGKN